MENEKHYTKRIVSNCLILVVLLSFYVKPQTVYDTLYLHPDTTTFLDQTVIIVDDIVNMAVKFTVDSGWNSYQIEKILLSEPTGIDPNGFVYLFISTGEFPEENMLDTIKIFTKPSFPDIEEISIDPPVNINYSKDFFISGGIIVITVSYPLQDAVPGEYAFWYSLQKWVEYVPYYFNLKVIVKKNLTGITEDNEIPVTFNLEQNYPNPFNGLTKIIFNSPECGITDLEVYDIIGRKVYVQEINTLYGVNQIVVNAEKFISGIYFYRVSVNNKYSSTKKMILLK